MQSCSRLGAREMKPRQIGGSGTAINEMLTIFLFLPARDMKSVRCRSDLLPYLWPPVPCAMKKNGHRRQSALPRACNIVPGQTRAPTSIGTDGGRYFNGQKPREYAAGQTPV